MLVHEKTTQAIAILDELGIDVWLTFVRETSAGGDPVLPLIYGPHSLTWQSALLLCRTGERIAIVGRFDAITAEQVGVYTEVIPYDQSIQPHLLAALERFDPRQIALNYSPNDAYADGLGHGLYQVLLGYLASASYADRLVSAEGIIGALRGRKTPAEVDRLRTAVATTLEIYRRAYDFMQPGMSEGQVGAFMHQEMAALGIQETAWDRPSCPAVNSGPDSPVGHAGPTDLRLERGHIVHFDFGIRQDDYCSDIQRVVYLLRPGETRAPEPVQRGFDTVLAAVDAAALRVIVEAGYPEYRYATGHHLGRNAHDGAGVLGPAWERYGDTPYRVLEAGHVYTVEPGLAVPGYGYIGLEEDVLVTEQGAVYLGEPQRALILR